MQQHRRGRTSSGRSSIAIRRRGSRRGCTFARRASRCCSASRVPDARRASASFARSASSVRRRRPTAGTSSVAHLPRGSVCAKSISSRKSAATTASTRSSRRFPPLTAPRLRPIRGSRAIRLVRRVLTAAGLSEAVTFGFIEAKAAALVAAGRRADRARSRIRCRRNSTRCVRRCCRGSSTPSRTTAVTDAATSALFEIGTRFTARAAKRARVGAAWTGAAAEHWSTAHARSISSTSPASSSGCARRSASAVRFEPATMPFLVPGQIGGHRRGRRRRSACAGLLAPAIVDARGAPRQDAVFVAELNLDAARGIAWTRSATAAVDAAAASSVRRPRSLDRRRRMPCLLKSFVAPFSGRRAMAAPLRGVVSSIGIRAKARRRHGQPVGAAHISGAGPHADRRGRPGHIRQDSCARSSANTAREQR